MSRFSVAPDWPIASKLHADWFKVAVAPDWPIASKLHADWFKVATPFLAQH